MQFYHVSARQGARFPHSVSLGRGEHVHREWWVAAVGIARTHGLHVTAQDLPDLNASKPVPVPPAASPAATSARNEGAKPARADVAIVRAVVNAATRG